MENRKRLKLFVVLQAVSIFWVFGVVSKVLESLVSQTLYEQMMDAGEIVILCAIVLQIKHFIFCKRESRASKLIPVIQQYKQVSNTEFDLIETGIKEEEFPVIKNHIQYILGNIKEQAPSIPEGKLKFKFDKASKKYCITIKYSYFGQEDEIFEQAKEELHQCIGRLEQIYELKHDCNEGYEGARILLPARL